MDSKGRMQFGSSEATSSVVVEMEKPRPEPFFGASKGSFFEELLEQSSLRDTFCPFETWLFPPKKQ